MRLHLFQIYVPSSRVVNVYPHPSGERIVAVVRTRRTCRPSPAALFVSRCKRAMQAGSPPPLSSAWGVRRGISASRAAPAFAIWLAAPSDRGFRKTVSRHLPHIEPAQPPLRMRRVPRPAGMAVARDQLARIARALPPKATTHGPRASSLRTAVDA